MKKSNPMKNSKSESATSDRQSSISASKSDYEKHQPDVADNTNHPNSDDSHSSISIVADSFSDNLSSHKTNSQSFVTETNISNESTISQSEIFSKEEVDRLCNEAYIRGKNEAIESYIFSDSQTRLTPNSNQNYHKQLHPGRRSVWDDVF